MTEKGPRRCTGCDEPIEDGEPVYCKPDYDLATRKIDRLRGWLAWMRDGTYSRSHEVHAAGFREAAKAALHGDSPPEVPR